MEPKKIVRKPPLSRIEKYTAKQGSATRAELNREIARADYNKKAVEHWTKLYAFPLPKNFGENKVKRGKKFGRPRVVTEKVVRLLESAFAYDCTIEEACLTAGIYPVRYYEFIQEYPDFTKTVELLRNIPVMIARRTVIQGLVFSSSNAMDYLKRKKRKEFGDSLDHTSLGEKIFDVETKKKSDQALSSFLDSQTGDTENT